VWYSLQPSIDAATLSLALRSEEFRDTFKAEGYIGSDTTLNHLNQIAFKALNQIHVAHITHNKLMAPLEKIPDDGKY
jgi:hypothetical protein